MSKSYLFTSESVSEGHPDKIADQISDAILDSIITLDKNAKVAAETLVKNNLVVLAGEISTYANVNYMDIVKDVIKNIGYDKEEYGFCYDKCANIICYNEQSRDIARGVNHGDMKELGAGDQGLMFGYACDETETLMPLPIYYAHKLMKQHAKIRKNKTLSWLRPDAKTQITVRYNSENGSIEGIEKIVFSTQHDPDVNISTIIEAVIEEIIKPIIPLSLMPNKKDQFLINPTGMFIIGGPTADCGLTGRKIIVDTYGGSAPHGGGAFSGKDPTKVDRSAAYMARYIAKNIVASKMAKSCQVQLAYAIGRKDPVSIHVHTFDSGRNKISDFELTKIVENNFDLTPGGIIEFLELLNPIFKKTSVYGHFGREDENFSWEELNSVNIFNNYK